MKKALLIALSLSAVACFAQPFNGVEEAKEILRNDYYYQFLNAPTETNAAVNNFLAEVKRYVPLADNLQESLFLELRYRGDSIVKLGRKHDNLFLRSQQANFIPFMGMDVGPIVQTYLSENDYEALCTELTINRMKSISAYSFLSKSMRSSMLKFYGDDIVAVLYDKEFQYMLKEVIFKE